MPVNSFDTYYMSWKPDRSQLKRPVYQTLAELLEKDIRSGKLSPGTKLPPQRELADYLDLNFTTITRTYKLCEMKGLIHAVTGKGTFVSSFEEHPATISTEFPHPVVVDLAFVTSFDLCNDMITDTAKKVIGNENLGQFLNYRHPTGMLHQKEAALQWLSGFGVKSDPEHLMIVSGVQNGLAIALSSFFTAGDRIAVDRYTYANFIELAKLYRLQLVPVDGDEMGMRPEELDFQCRINDIKGIFLAPSCNNPTTVVMSEERKKELAHVIEEYQLLLLEDDNMTFLTAGIISDYKMPLYRNLSNRYIYLSGTSKALCPGLRVAYIICSDDLKNTVSRSIFNINVKTSSLDVEIVTQLIQNGTAERIAMRKKALSEECNAIFRSYFPECTDGHPLSFYRWLPINLTPKGILVEQTFQKVGIRVYHSDRFLAGSQQGQPHLRVALTGPSSMRELDAGLRVLRDMLEEMS